MDTVLDLKSKLDSGWSAILDIHTVIEERLRELDEKSKEWDKKVQLMNESAEKAKSKIVLDVGGTRFATAKSTLLKFENTYFTGLLSSSNWKPGEDGSYFIDRNPKYFSIILDYLRFGDLNMDGLTSGDIKALKRDMDYFQIPFIFTSGKITKKKFKSCCSRIVIKYD